MPAIYYLIPTTDPPYSRENPQRPKYLHEHRCNWTGYPLQRFGYYICKVNTTHEKHKAIRACDGIIQLPDWDINLSEAPDLLVTWLNDRRIPFDQDETSGELMGRLIQTDIFNLDGIQLQTPFRQLLISGRDVIARYCDIFRESRPSHNETIGQLTKRLGKHLWYGKDLSVEEF